MKTTVPFQLFEIKDQGYHIAIDVEVNGIVVRMIVDTGASKTVFDLDWARQQAAITVERNEELSTGLGTNSMESFHFTAASIQLGELGLQALEVLAIDLSHVNDTYEQLDLPTIAGVLGSDLLSEYKAVIDYGTATLTLHF